MKPNNQGFTLVEIVVVMVLISIIAATVFGRSISTGDIGFAGESEKIKSHIRYAKSMAMKRSEIWGIFNSGNDYWLFQWNNPGDEVNMKLLPGEELVTILLSDLGVTMPYFVLYFDSIGKPYEMNRFNPVLSDLEITIETPDKSHSKSFYITPETGLMRD